MGLKAWLRLSWTLFLITFTFLFPWGFFDCADDFRPFSTSFGDAFVATDSLLLLTISSPRLELDPYPNPEPDPVPESLSSSSFFGLSSTFFSVTDVFTSDSSPALTENSARISGSISKSGNISPSCMPMKRSSKSIHSSKFPSEKSGKSSAPIEKLSISPSLSSLVLLKGDTASITNPRSGKKKSKIELAHYADKLSQCNHVLLHATHHQNMTERVREKGIFPAKLSEDWRERQSMFLCQWVCLGVVLFFGHSVKWSVERDWISTTTSLRFVFYAFCYIICDSTFWVCGWSFFEGFRKSEKCSWPLFNLPLEFFFIYRRK